jgi:multiple sugar transport system permease protein
MRIYAQDAIPDSMIEAGRIDGAGEVQIFFRLALRTLAPGFVTVLLFTLVATWNNYFLPLIMLNNPDLYPVTVGLASWSSQSAGGGGSTGELLALVVTGSMVSVLPLIAAFLLLQRYWQSGLSAGGVKG